ncbi:hypothetical protein [Planococcus alpniumensis]|uniref:hypothetical protein n=1 Tax=Planococcus alpniumensis TaxID=2708345 RepID=UPI001B8BA8BE|nr:hypothetical protein [Planococcus sp. MSAK28401]
MEERGELVKPIGAAGQEPNSSANSRARIGIGTAGGTIRFLGYDNGGTAINQVDIWMTQEELPVFIHALVIHPMPLPTDYLQTAKPDENGFWVRIRSHESPKVFVSRLSSAIGCLEEPA